MPKSLITRLNKVEDALFAKASPIDEFLLHLQSKDDKYIQGYIERGLQVTGIILEDKSVHGKTKQKIQGKMRQKIQQAYDSLKKEQTNV